MKETTRGALPYPEDTDPPNGPAQIKALAERDEVLHNYSGATNAKAKAIAGENSTSSSSYVELGTADKVEGIVLPTNGLIVVQYRALAKATSGGRAAIFLGSNQLKIPRGNDRPPVVIEAAQGDGGGTGVKYGVLSSWTGGLMLGAATEEGEEDATFVTTGMIPGQLRGFYAVNGGAAEIASGGVGGEMPDLPPLGGVCYIEAAAGTYTVSVRYKTSSGTIYAKERLLRVWTREFA